MGFDFSHFFIILFFCLSCLCVCFSAPSQYVAAHGEPVPAPAVADAHQTYEWHFASEAWNSWGAEAVAHTLLKHQRLGLNPMQWFTVSSQRQIVHYTLQRWSLLHDFYASVGGVSALVLEEARLGAALVESQGERVLDPSVFDSLRA